MDCRSGMGERRDGGGKICEDKQATQIKLLPSEAHPSSINSLLRCISVYVHVLVASCQETADAN